MSTATRAAALAGALVVLALGASVASADPRTCPGATPVPNDVIMALRVFDDCPGSIVTSTDVYPDSVVIHDAENDCFGFANLHGWNFSADGGATAALFENCSTFEYSADVRLWGTGSGEGGLRISPWWNAPHYAVDGRFMLNTATGEIACFGGRLPFYSFTNAHGIRYTKGETAHLAIAYAPNGLSAESPATITYTITWRDTVYTSGPLPFDEGNPAEAAEHGSWGLLNASGVGGYVQVLVGAGTAVDLGCTWSGIDFEAPVVVDTDEDDDGVPNDGDQCAGTPLGALIDATGCSLDQLVPCEGPLSGGAWKNHGQYVSAIAHEAERFLREELITEWQKDSIVSAHARSTCGKGMGSSLVRGVMAAAGDPRRAVTFELAAPARVRLAVVDVTGRRVADLVDTFHEGGSHTVFWDASRLKSGVYFYTLRAGDQRATERFVLLR